MLSRTADHLFWLARCMERAGHARSAWGEAHKHCARAARGGVLGAVEDDDAV
ncbi:MAG: alpha-E domain-containing protein [Rubrivivax sp.]|nr:alpha-E domain-containing protein [Rubrivivax sp.]